MIISLCNAATSLILLLSEVTRHKIMSSLSVGPPVTLVRHADKIYIDLCFTPYDRVTFVVVLTPYFISSALKRDTMSKVIT